SPDMARLTDKVAVITGAARGVGAGVARRFVAEGARVALLDVLDDAGAALAAALGGAARFQHCDLADEAQVRAAIDDAADHFGGIDVLYNNAAVIGYGRRIADLPTAEWDRTMAVNLRGPFLCC